jgi:hypothetical protein
MNELRMKPPCHLPRPPKHCRIQFVARNGQAVSLLLDIRKARVLKRCPLIIVPAVP